VLLSIAGQEHDEGQCPDSPDGTQSVSSTELRRRTQGGTHRRSRSGRRGTARRGRRRRLAAPRGEAVSFRYPGGGTTATTRDVLTDLDLVLEGGRSTAIVGVNGAGKTTLVTLLARLRDPTAGRILIDGVPLAELPARAWQRQVAVVYQDFTCFPLTVRENVALDLLGEPVDPDLRELVARRAGAAA
jgi:ABC-type multidrug transport system fused ATPase/permease subunit